MVSLLELYVEDAITGHTLFCAQSAALIEKSFDQLVLTRQLRKQLSSICGLGEYGGEKRASDITYREEQGHTIIREVSNFVKADRSAIGYKVYHFTITHKDWFVDIHEPEINIPEIKSAIRSAITTDDELNAFGVIEIQAMKRKENKKTETLLMPHGHVYAWTYDPDFRPARLNSRIRKFIPYQQSTAIHTTEAKLEDWSIHGLSSYLSKMPMKIKHEKYNSDTEKFYFKTNNIRPLDYLRLIEVLSSIPAPCLNFGLREGANLNSNIRQHMTKWRNSHEECNVHVHLGEEYKVWSKLWKANKYEYPRPQIVTD